MRTTFLLVAIVLLVTYAKCEEENEEPKVKTINGSYKLLKSTVEDANPPNLQGHEYEVMIITHKDNPDKINFSIRGINIIGGVITKKADNKFETDPNIFSTLVGASDEEIKVENYLANIFVSLTNIKYDEAKDELTVESPKATLVFEKL